MSEAAPVWIGTSWKMNKTRAEARAFAERLAEASPPFGIQRFVVPPFTALAEVAALLDGANVVVGAQNMHWDDAGAWTGEVSAPMIADCGVGLVELGHSERRAHFGETDRTVGLKVAAALRHGLTPLVCVGETADDREADRADAVLAAQVVGALAEVPMGDTSLILLAYEPVWAIGEGGTPASPDYADARHAEIGKAAERAIGRPLPCLYGGSVNPGNCADLIARPHIDGLFIGRAAWEVEGYLDILARCEANLSEGTDS
jgi:triosephosphate isomerase